MFLAQATSSQETTQPGGWDVLVDGASSWLNDYGLITLAALGTLAWRRWGRPSLTHSKIHLRYSVAQDLAIKSIIGQMLALFEADRVLVCEFHNGEKLASQRHWIKLSATQEDVAPGIERISPKIRGIPQSQLAHELELIQDGALHTFHKDNDIAESFRDSLITLGVTVVRQQLLSYNGEALGVLSIHYRDDLCKDGECKTDKEFIKKLATTEKQTKRMEELVVRLVDLMKNRSEFLDMIQSILSGGK